MFFFRLETLHVEIELEENFYLRDCRRRKRKINQQIFVFSIQLDVFHSKLCFSYEWAFRFNDTKRGMPNMSESFHGNRKRICGRSISDFVGFAIIFYSTFHLISDSVDFTICLGFKLFNVERISSFRGISHQLFLVKNSFWTWRAVTEIPTEIPL